MNNEDSRSSLFDMTVSAEDNSNGALKLHWWLSSSSNTDTDQVLAGVAFQNKISKTRHSRCY